MRKIDGMIPASYADAVRALPGGIPWRKLNANTELIVTNWANGLRDRIGLVLHGTVIVEYDRAGCYRLNSGGWHTVTTKARINAALRETAFGVIQRNGNWFIMDMRDRIITPFRDGVVIWHRPGPPDTCSYANVGAEPRGVGAGR